MDGRVRDPGIGGGDENHQALQQILLCLRIQQCSVCSQANGSPGNPNYAPKLWLPTLRNALPAETCDQVNGRGCFFDLVRVCAFVLTGGQRAFTRRSRGCNVGGGRMEHGYAL